MKQQLNTKTSFQITLTAFGFIIAATVLVSCSNDKPTVLSAKESRAEQTLSTAAAVNSNSAKIALGKLLFEDPNLSTPPGKACAGCHAKTAGFADPDQSLPVSRGAHADRFTNRNTPTISYAAFTPALHYDDTEELWLGGLFLDGRAATLEEQLAGPLGSAVEMNSSDKVRVLEKLRKAHYADAFIAIYGRDALASEDNALTHLSDAIAAFERSPTVSPFNSKYDYYLTGKATLTAQELRGLELFEAEDKGNCAACHPSRPNTDGQPPLFTDFSYDNIGLPANPDNPFLKLAAEFNPDGEDFIDQGLGKHLNDPDEAGKFRVPTLRNVALTAPYTHNGVFETLKEVVNFYNTRDTDPSWAAPEVSANVNTEELGDLQLSEQDVDDLVAFMKTLSDGYQADRQP